MARIVVGMSGGVDSSVSAALLKSQGHEVIGLFMKNWDESQDPNGPCTAASDYEDVARVCDRLDIQYYAIEFIEEYRNYVFERFLKEYQQGLTPNPDILCNREIKFDVFLKKAMELGADYLATGHYAQIKENGSSVELHKGLDSNKDQSYFICTLTESHLKKVLFPIGNLEKSKVREIARDFNLATKDKKDSTGICFIGERDFREFLSQYLALKPGDFRTLSGDKVGRHTGSAFYTLGQRKGLGLGGQGEPWFVVAKDPDKNIVYVERGVEHPALFVRELWAQELSWVNEAPRVGQEIRCTAKVRYRQADQECSLRVLEDSRVHVVFDLEQRAVTPGQAVVFYQGTRCLGGGFISSTGPSLFARSLNS